MQIKLDSLAEVIIPKRMKKTEDYIFGYSQYLTIVTPNDFSKSGYTTDSSTILNFELPIPTKNNLNQYDILLSKTGTPFKVAIIGQLEESLYVHESIFIIRIKEASKAQDTAIVLYMYLKSDHGQNALLNLFKGKARKTLSKIDLSNLDIPAYQKQLPEIINNFEQEHKIQKEINASQLKIQKIHEFFDLKKEVTDNKTNNSFPRDIDYILDFFNADKLWYNETKKKIKQIAQSLPSDLSKEERIIKLYGWIEHDTEISGDLLIPLVEDKKYSHAYAIQLIFNGHVDTYDKMMRWD